MTTAGDVYGEMKCDYGKECDVKTVTMDG